MEGKRERERGGQSGVQVNQKPPSACSLHALSPIKIKILLQKRERERERVCMCVRVSGSEGIWPKARTNLSMCRVYSRGFIFDAAIRNLYNSGFASVPD